MKQELLGAFLWGVVKMSDVTANQDELIREQAYYLWALNGSRPGDDLQYWETAKILVGKKLNTGSVSIPGQTTYYEGGISAQPPL